MNNTPVEYIIKLAGVRLLLRFRQPGTEQYFRDYLDCRYTQAENYREQPNLPVVEVPDIDELLEQMELIPVTDAFSEYSAMLFPVSDALLRFNRFCFHGAAFIWHEKAYIFTAPTGVGKTTQYRNWKKRYGKEVHILNGDKPVLEVGRDGTIWVHHSPWSGKERYSSRRTAKLGGIIYLEQGKENVVQRLSESEAVYPFIQEVFSLMREAEDCHLIADLTEQVLTRIPVWKLVNTGDVSSAELMHDTLQRAEMQNCDESGGKT